jgi:L-rhamnose isomerase
VRALFLEIARGDVWERVFVALDFFDASINRIAAYLIGARATRQAMLCGLLDPSARLRAAENAGRGHERLALMEQAKALPWAAVWDELCARADVPVGIDWLKDVARYEKTVLAERR